MVSVTGQNRQPTRRKKWIPSAVLAAVVVILVLALLLYLATRASHPEEDTSKPKASVSGGVGTGSAGGPTQGSGSAPLAGAIPATGNSSSSGSSDANSKTQSGNPPSSSGVESGTGIEGGGPANNTPRPVSGPGPGNERGKQGPPSRPQNPTELEVWESVKIAVKQVLKVPDSAVFPSLGVQGTSVRREGNSYAVEGFVDARNSRDEIRRSGYSCTVRHARERAGWEVVDLQFSD